MSKRNASPNKQADDALLDSCIASYKIEKPRHLLFAVGLIAAFLPAYLFHSVSNLQWDAIENAPLFIAIPIACAFMLSQAYQELYETGFHKQNKNYDETKTAEEANTLKQLRLQAALGWAMGFGNLLFIALTLFMQFYLFRRVDLRANFLMSPTMAAGVVWWLANKNEETRKKRLRRK
jgi:hypothetical protein